MNNKKAQSRILQITLINISMNHPLKIKQDSRKNCKISKQNSLYSRRTAFLDKKSEIKRKNCFPGAANHAARKTDRTIRILGS